FFVCFFFQAEDGIRDDLVTGVQTCALPISLWGNGARRGSCRASVWSKISVWNVVVTYPGGMQEHIPGFRSEKKAEERGGHRTPEDRKSTRLNSSHQIISYAVFCLKKKNINT